MNGATPQNKTSLQSELAERFKNIRSRTEEICRPLKTEDYVPQIVTFASPAKWHLAHTTWFFETMILVPYSKKYRVFDPDFNFLFNSYYNTIGERTNRANRGSIKRPSVAEVYKYRTFVDEAILQFIESENCNSEVLELLELGLQHEQQHQELLVTDIKILLFDNPTFPIYQRNADLLKDVNPDSQQWIKVDKGLYDIGYSGNEFCFDNEKSQHQVYLNEFEISNSLITNAEYLEFINDGGYDKFEYWLDEGWHWINTNKIFHPMYWLNKEGNWYQFTLAGLVDLKGDSILGHISFYEAQAFATWKGMRLPTEFEWEAASNKIEWGKRWEWTYSAYLPYPKFKIAEGAVGEYNGKFMINQMVLRGSSVATAKGHSRNTYRNFFHPEMQWQYTGIRLAK